MKSILCYGDSNTFGSNPAGLPVRHPYSVRWPGRLQALLGEEFLVIEEGMGGRTTVWDDPLEPGRRGLDFLLVALQSHRPLDLVILSLGTNDCKTIFHASPRAITRGMQCLMDTVRRFSYGPGVQVPEILIISPIHMGPKVADSVFGVFDEESARKAEQLAPLYEQLARQYRCGFLDGAKYGFPGPDQLHMTAEGHKALAEAVAGKVKGMLGEGET